MSKSIFVSYSHQQGEWVCDRLVPVLKAGGIEVLIDCERFEAGQRLLGQIDETQAKADIHVLVLSPEYLESNHCRHEMEQAISCDPQFEKGVVVPVKRADVELPAAIRESNPLYVDLTDDSTAEAWDLMLTACGTELGTSIPDWLTARDEVRRLLKRNESINLVIEGAVAWRELLNDLCRHAADLAIVNLEKGTTASRRGLIEEILDCWGEKVQVPPEPEDLAELDHYFKNRDLRLLALINFDLASHRPAYGVDFFAALRFLIESGKLVLLVQSRQPFATLLPAKHPLSEIDLQTVVLRGHR